MEYNGQDARPGGTNQSDMPSAGSSLANCIVPVVLSGGGGTRLWPASTKDMPKQFLPLINCKCLFEEALDRVRNRLHFTAPIVAASLHHADLCERMLGPDGEGARLILEPYGRNTAPAVVMAAALARELHGEEALLLVMPSDHVIEDVPAFHEAIALGETAARQGLLVTFGIQPHAPEVGYGYLEAGEQIAGAAGVYSVVRFVEKPSLEVAEAMTRAGDYLWNAGIFLFRADVFLNEAITSTPTIAKAAIDAIAASERSGIRVNPCSALIADCPSESIDYAIMEKSSRIAVVPMSPGWSDLGSWDALATLIGSDAAVGPVTALDCQNCYIRSDGLEIAALGVGDLIIVASGRRLLILPRGRSQEVKRLLSAMESMAA